MSKPDYYETLGVSRDASDSELKSAFRKMAMRYHPDKNPDDKVAEAKFKEVGEAYEALKDPDKRAAYDRYGHSAFEGGMGGGGGGFGGGFAGGSMHDIFEDIFGEMMGGGRSRSGGRRQGSDLQYNLEISLLDAFHGKKVQIEIPTTVHCDTCSGSGSAPGSKPTSCVTCGGVGQVRSSTGFFSVQRTCPHCQGRGTIINNPCSPCGGSGTVRESKSLSIEIPPGVDDGNKIRLSGKGEAGTLGGSSGDLYIFISISSHAFFHRDGADIHCLVPISFSSATLGGEFDVRAIDGTKKRVKVPEGTQNGKRFKLKGMGMPVLRSRKFGDMYIQLAVETPQKLNKQQKQLLRDFQQAEIPANNPESTEFFSQMNKFFGKKN